MKLFERVRAELLALGFDKVAPSFYFVEGTVEFAAEKSGVSYDLSLQQTWAEWDLDGPNTLYWVTDEHEGEIIFTASEPPGKGAITTY